MLNRVASPKPIETPQLPGRSADAAERPRPSPHSAHPTGPAPPFEYEDEPPQTDAQATRRTAPPGKDARRDCSG